MPMEELKISEKVNEKLSVKQKCLQFLKTHRFPLTVEPLVWFASLSYGLSEVRDSLYSHYEGIKGIKMCNVFMSFYL